MKRLAAILVFLVALIPAGCQGGGTATPTQSTPTGATSTLTIRPVKVPAGRLPREYQVNMKFTPNNDTPAFFVNALRQKKPIFLEIYAEGDAITDAMLLGIDELQTKYRTGVVFLLINGDRPQTYGNLSQQLPFKYTPQVLIFNKDGTIIRSYTGYIDKEPLEQGIYDALNRGY